ncbi:MAG: uracil-DNA glycosylase family protein [Candidatus Bathyarchaeia archaeon]
MQNKDPQMEALRHRIKHCTDCGLCENARNKVPGDGPLDARVVLVGEAPGAQEDKEGKPFVGQAGNLLDDVLREAGLARGEVYITNVVKCKPPGNRNPRKNEVEECQKHLLEELHIIGPKIIAPLGNTALSYFMDLFKLEKRSIGEVHGECLGVSSDWASVLLVPQYHPAAAIYNRNLLPRLREDMKAVAHLMRSL